MSSASARALNRIILDNRFTVEELALEAGCSTRHLYNVRSGQAHLSDEKAERLSRFLCAEGELRYARAFLDSRYDIVRRTGAHADGIIDDEMNDLVRYAGLISAAHREHDGEAMDEAIGKLEQVFSCIKAERGLLPT